MKIFLSSFWQVDKSQLFSLSLLLKSDVPLFLHLSLVYLQSVDFVSKLGYPCFIGRHIGINFISFQPGVLERLVKIHQMLFENLHITFLLLHTSSLLEF